jgi:transposase
MPKERKPRPKSKANKKEYEDRLRMVTRLFIRGISEDEISLAVGVDQSTVSRDLDEIRKRNQERFDAKLENWQDPKTLAAEVNQKYDELEREAWDAVSNSQGTSKVAGLKEVREINEKRIQILQRLGLIYEEPAKLATDNYDELQAQIQRRRKERGDL